MQLILKEMLVLRQPNCVVHNEEGMSGRGYSYKIIKALEDARASSTNKVDDSKWRLFAAICSSLGDCS